MAIEEWANAYVGRSLSEYFGCLKNADISMSQAYALTFLHCNAPCRISEICEHMMVSAAANQMMDRLENRNQVTRILDPGDRQVRNGVLPEHGEEVVQQSIDARQGWVKEIPADLSEG